VVTGNCVEVGRELPS
jgi:hypothetical protein